MRPEISWYRAPRPGRLRGHQMVSGPAAASRHPVGNATSSGSIFALNIRFDPLSTTIKVMRRSWFMLIGCVVLAVAGCVEVTGPAGPPGNANVRALTVRFVAKEATLNGTVASQGYTVPEITPSVVDRGAVLVYLRDQRTWTAMPLTVSIENADLAVVDYTFTIGYAYDDGFLEVFIEASTQDEVVWEEIADRLPAEYIMKVIVIDGYYNTQEAGISPADYEAIRAYYGVEG